MFKLLPLRRTRNRINSPADKKDLFVIVAGPGGQAFNKKHIEKTRKILIQNGCKTVLIGDGNTALDKDITTELSLYNDYEHLSIMFVALGYRTLENKHILWLGDKANTNTQSLLKEIKKIRKSKRTDLFFTSSYGETILNTAGKKLSKNSKITVFAPNDKLVTGDELIKIVSEHYSHQHCKS